MNQLAYPKLQVAMKRLHPEAKIPAYQTAGAAGFDIHTIIDPETAFSLLSGQIELGVGETLKFHTGIAVSIGNPSWALLLLARSGLGSKGIVLANQVGLIDSDYQGELIVMLKNTGDVPFTINHGDRIAQGMFTPVIQADFIEVDSFNHESERGTRGFGSTGV